MAKNISTAIEFVSQCIACLSEDVAGVRSSPDLAKIYEELIQEEISEKLNENSYIFCSTCEKHLRNFNTFRGLCKESWKQLATHFTDTWACELEQLLCGSPTKSVQLDKIKLNDLQDAIFLVDSDSEASTLPLDPESDHEVISPIVMKTSSIEQESGEEIVFIDVEVEIANGDANSNENGNHHSDDQIINSPRETPVPKKKSLISMGLLPKSTNTCAVCHIKTKDITSHYLTAHTTVELNKYICSSCTKIYKTEEQIIKHIKSYHTVYLKPRKCSLCTDDFINSGDYFRHIVVHRRESNKFVCNICGKIERNQSSLQSHVLRIHNGASYCKYCYKAFHDDEEYASHMEKEEEKHGEKTFVCDVCGYKTRYKPQLKMHIQSLHKIRKNQVFTCQECGKKLNSSESLRHHVKFLHRKKYKCTDCDLLFAFLKDVRYHYERDHTETGLREPCDICGKVLSRKAIPLHKKTIHSNTKEYQCNVCDKAFNQKVMLKTHMYKHTGFRPYFCSICNRGFYDSPILMKHFLREHGKTVTKEDIKRDCKRKPIDQSPF